MTTTIAPGVTLTPGQGVGVRRVQWNRFNMDAGDLGGDFTMLSVQGASPPSGWGSLRVGVELWPVRR